jgi:hypothetical protein
VPVPVEEEQRRVGPSSDSVELQTKNIGWGAVYTRNGFKFCTPYGARE